MSTELAVIEPKELYRVATDVAGLCKDAVVKTSMKIGGKNYVKVEGWQTIGAAHGCLAEIESVAEADVEGVHGLLCWAKLKRISDQAVLTRASAFIGDDEDQKGISGKKYARYAKVQTRAISRVLSNAFRYVVVLMNAGLETTPAEEMHDNNFGGSEKSGSGAETGGSSGAAASQEVRPTIQEEQDLEGILDRVWDRGDWTYGVIAGIEFSTKRPELAEEIKAHLMQKVRVRVAKYIVTGGKIKFRPRSIEIIPVSPNESETEQEEGEEAA